jgi:hypothetical protein
MTSQLYVVPAMIAEQNKYILRWCVCTCHF